MCVSSTTFQGRGLSFLLCLALLPAMLGLCSCAGKKPGAAEKPASAREHTLGDAQEIPSSPRAPESPRSSRKPAEESTAVPRADPGYLQWLEKQSMLAQSTDLTRIVSGSELPWRGGESSSRNDILLEAAGIWLRVHPASLLTDGSRPVLKELADDSALHALKSAGIQGIFLAPAGEPGRLWHNGSASGEDPGEDAVSLGFAEQLGNDKDFEQLRARAEQRGIQIGGDILSPAVGLGPDFQLAARAVREYPGAFIMVEIPRAAWGALPAGQNPKDVLPLLPEQVARLSSERLLPPALTRDTMSWAVPGGWAATGEIRCADGQLRRWAFRRHLHSTRPLLNWDDPSGAAQRILSGSVIRQVGVLRQALAGIRIEPLIGLDAAYSPAQRSLEPAPSALRSLAREIRRYGGWSLERDFFPPALNEQILEAGPDFIPDNITSPAAEYALLTGDTAPLREMLAGSKHLDHRRLMRALPGPEGILLHALRQAPFPPGAFDRLREILAGRVNCPVEHDVLYAGGPSLAVAANAAYGIKEDPTPGATGSHLGPHLLLTTLRAALPGLFFLSGADLAGALNISGVSPACTTLGGWALTSSAASRAATRKGFERAQTIYPPVQKQLKQADSYLARLASLSRMRAGTKAAQSVLLGPLPSDRGVVLPVLTRLPDGSRLLIAANFSPKPVDVNITLPDALFSEALDLLNNTTIKLAGTECRLDLAPWDCRVLHLGNRATSPQTSANPAGATARDAAARM